MFLELWMKISGIKSYCRICARPIYYMDTSWGKRGFCVYCNEAYNEAKQIDCTAIRDMQMCANHNKELQ